MLTDRAQGAASLASGELELMVHRRLLLDDGRGMDEALNETVGGMSHYPWWRRSGEGITVSGKHVVLLSSKRKGMRELREAVREMYFAPVMFIGRNLALAKNGALLPTVPVDPVLDVTALSHCAVDIVSLLKWGKGEYLLRLGHSYAVAEDEQLSRTVEVDLTKLVKPLGITTIEERSLSANQNKGDMVAKRPMWKLDNSDSEYKYHTTGDEIFIKGKVKVTDASVVVSLKPMQIRTFLLSREIE